MTFATLVQFAIIRAGVPISGLSIGNVDDRSTWRVVPAPLQLSATPIILSFSETDPVLLAAAAEYELEQILSGNPVLAALHDWMCESLKLVDKEKARKGVARLYALKIVKVP